MSVYYWILSLLVICVFYFSRGDCELVYNRNGDSIYAQRITSVICVILLATISGIRDISVGVDTSRYIARYMVFGDCSWENIFLLAKYYSFEYGFAILCKLLNLVSRDYRFFLILSSLWIAFFLIKAISKYSVFPTLSILIYVCWGYWAASMNTIREMMIIPLLYISIQMAQERKLWSFLIIVFISSLIHTVGLVFLIIYPLCNLKITIRTISITSIISVLVGLGGYRYLGGILARTSFGWYFNAETSTSGVNTLVLLIAMIFVCHVLKEDLYEIDSNIDIWMLFILFGIVSTSIGMSIGVFARVTRIFLMSNMFVFPDIYLVMKKKGLGFSSLLVLVILLLFYYFRYVMASPISSSMTIPYSSWLWQS